jgi:hypothetical protein
LSPTNYSTFASYFTILLSNPKTKLLIAHQTHFLILQNMKQTFTILSLLFLLFSTVSIMAQTTYTWTGATSTVYSDASNWSPARTTTAPSDIILFTSNATVTGFTTQTISQLKLSNNATVSIQAMTGNRSLIVSNSSVAGDDVDIPVGCKLIMATASTATDAVRLTVGTTSGVNVTANIAGIFEIQRNFSSVAVGASVNNGLNTTNGITTVTGTIINNGGVIITTTPSNLVFANGSKYISTRTDGVTFPTTSFANADVIISGLINPRTSPSPSVTNVPTSLKSLTWDCPAQDSTVIISSSQMQGAATIMNIAGNLDIISTGPVATTGSSLTFNLPVVNVGGNMLVSARLFECSRSTVATPATFTVAGNLTIALPTTGPAPTVNIHSGTSSSNTVGSCILTVNDYIQSGGALSVTPSVGVSSTLVIKGNFNKTGGTISTTGTAGKIANIKFAGTSAQTYTSTGTGSNPAGKINIEIDNPAGLTLASSLTMNTGATLTLTNGVIFTGSTTFSVPSTAFIVGGSNSSHINGRFTRVLTATTPFLFPVGKNGVYRPLTVTPENTTSVTYRAEFFNSPNSISNVSSPIVLVNPNEYFNLTRTAGTTNAKIGLDYIFLSGAVANTAHLNIAKLNGSLWIKEATTAAVVSGTTSTGTVTTDNFVNLGTSTTANTSFTIGSENSATTLANPAPSMTVTGSTTAFATVAGTPSVTQTYTVSGSNLTANIVITAPSGYQVSLSPNSGFMGIVSVAPSIGNVPTTTIYVRLSGASVGTPSGNIINSSTGVTTQNVAVSGTVYPAPIVTASAVTTTLTCTTPTTNITATGASTYAWTGTGGFTAATATITVSNAGTYSVVGTDGNGYTASASVVITENKTTPTITVTPTTAELTCTTPSTNITASGANTYAWTGTGGFTATTAIITVTNAGTYTVIGTNNNSGCTASVNVVITENKTAPSSSISGISTVCNGSSLSLTASGGGTYQWSSSNTFSATTATINFPNAMSADAGIYAVLVTSANGCTASASVQVIVNAIVAPPTPQANVTILTGNSISLTASGCAGTLKWFDASNNSLVMMPVMPSSATSYYAICEVSANGIECQSLPSTNVTVTIADNVMSVNSGNWEDGSTWNIGRPPMASEKAIIDSNHTVSITSNSAVAKELEYKLNANLNYANATAKLMLQGL